MNNIRNRCNGLVPAPRETTWPPAWFGAAPPPAALVHTSTDPLPAETVLSSWDLSAQQYERWEERVCIMHFDGRLPWPQAEALALADVLGLPVILPDAGPVVPPVALPSRRPVVPPVALPSRRPVVQAHVAPAPEQGRLFAGESVGPYVAT